MEITKQEAMPFTLTRLKDTKKKQKPIPPTPCPVCGRPAWISGAMVIGRVFRFCRDHTKEQQKEWGVIASR